MGQYIEKSALVAEINQRIEDYKSHKIDDSYHDGLIFALEDLRDDFLDTIEVKDANEALRTEYEKGRADVIAKACQFLHDYQEYPDHDISPTQLMEAFRLFMQIKD